MNKPEDIARCRYCGTERPRSELHQQTIIFQGTRNGRRAVIHETNLYCNEKPCGGRDQMGHEG